MLNTILSKDVFKKCVKKSLLISSISLLAACGSEDQSPIINTDYTAITEDSVPEGFTYESGVTATFYSNETYGPDERNVFDIYLPESEEPTPLIIFVHGGGFFTGDKSAAYDAPDEINDTLEAGVAFATINYSLLDVPGFNDATANDTEGLGKSLSDVKEALQYIRHNATEFNIDPENIAMYGISAGAISSLWLAYSDDMADSSIDESLNASESTRIVAAGAIETQGSMDVVRWEEILESIGVTLEVAAGLTLSLMESVLAIEASDTATSLALMREETGDIADFRATLDIPALIDDEDPAVFVSNTEVEVDATVVALMRLAEIQSLIPALLAESGAALSEGDQETSTAKSAEAFALMIEGRGLAPGIIGALLHFPTHPKAIVDAAAAAGATVVANIPQLGLPEPTGQTVIPFLLEELGTIQQP